MYQSEKRTDIINFIGPVNDRSVNNFFQITSLIIQGHNQFTFKESNPEKRLSSEVRIHISSSGGDAWQALAAFDQIQLLKQHVPSVITHNMGHVASSAVIIYLAADVRQASPHAAFLIHSHTYQSSRDEALSVGTLQGLAINLQAHTEIIVDTLATRTQAVSKNPETFTALAQNGTVVFNANKAKEAGIITANPANAYVPANAVLWDICF